MRTVLATVFAALALAGCGGGIWYDDCGDDMDRIRDTYGRPTRVVDTDGWDTDGELWYYDAIGLRVGFVWGPMKDCEVEKRRYPPRP